MSGAGFDLGRAEAGAIVEGVRTVTIGLMMLAFVFASGRAQTLLPSWPDVTLTCQDKDGYTARYLGEGVNACAVTVWPPSEFQDAVRVEVQGEVQYYAPDGTPGYPHYVVKSKPFFRVVAPELGVAVAAFTAENGAGTSTRLWGALSKSAADLVSKEAITRLLASLSIHVASGGVTAAATTAYDIVRWAPRIGEAFKSRPYLAGASVKARACRMNGECTKWETQSIRAYVPQVVLDRSDR